MIYLVQQADYGTFKDQLDQMYQLRAQTFGERLQWDVKITNGREYDAFDDQNPLYVLAIDENDKLEGSLRLLPTTGPNMLRDVFYDLLPTGETVISPLIWESSRFCISDHATERLPGSNLNRVTAQLLAALCEIGMLARWDAVVTVYDSRIKRVVRYAGCEGEILGSPKKFGRVTAYAGLFETNRKTLHSIRAATGFTQPVLHQGLTFGSIAA